MTLRRCLSMLFALLPVLVGKAHAQSYGNLPEIEYSNGAIKGQWIPYGRWWLLKGSPKVARGDANLVIGRMDQGETAHGRIELPVNESLPCWHSSMQILTEGENKSEFQLRLDRARLGETYRITLWFFRAPDASFLTTTINRAWQTAEENSVYSDTTLRRVIHEGIIADLRARTGTNVPVQIKPVREGSCVVTNNAIETEIKPEVIIAFRAAQASLANRNAARREYLGYTADVRNSIRDNRDVLDRAMLQLANPAIGRIIEADITAIITAFENREAPDQAVVARLTEAGKTCQAVPPLTPADCERLLTTSAIFAKYHRTPEKDRDPIRAEIDNDAVGWSALSSLLRTVLARPNLAGLTSADVDSLRVAAAHARDPNPASIERLRRGTVLGSTCFERTGARRTHLMTDDCRRLGDIAARAIAAGNRLAAITGFDQAIAVERQKFTAALVDAYLGIGAASLEATSWDDAQATSDKLRIGTATSYGAAWMAPFTMNDSEPFGMITLKFYRWAVDKSLPDPYWGKSQAARFSFTIGAVVGGGLDFRGQSLTKPLADLFPTVGIGYDITRDVTAHVGVVMFEQDNPIDSQDGNAFRTAPHVAIGFDFDAANRIANLLKSVGN